MKNSQESSNTSISAYIHIPFCEHICYYCDFKKVFLEGQPVDEYIQLLLKEMQLTTALYPDAKTPTIYIGGGTPTSLSAGQLDHLLAGVSEVFDLSQVEEFTVEANPGDLTKDKLQVMKNYGVDRLSMGVQTFDDVLLKKIGRKHTVQDVYDTVALLEQEDFQNVTIDLIYALPGQTLASFRDTLQQALALDLPHYALYSLILENKTMFMNWVRQGRMELPTQELEGEMFAQVMAAMEAAGRHQYEISNFARPGFESQHNLVYWNNQRYFGFGAGASGYLDNRRYKNFGPIQHYLKPLREGELPVYEEEFLSLKEQVEEEMFLGLRKRAGVSQAAFQSKYGLDFVKVYQKVLPKLFEKGWLTLEAGFLKMTDAGIFVGNEVFEHFLLDEAPRSED